MSRSTSQKRELSPEARERLQSAYQRSKKRKGGRKFSSVYVLVVLAVAAILVIIGYLLSVAMYTHSSQQVIEEENEAAAGQELVITDEETTRYAGHARDRTTHTHVRHDEIRYRSAGSSSCPPVIDNAYYDEDEENVVILERASYDPDEACTMDLEPVFQTISREDGELFDEDLEIRININHTVVSDDYLMHPDDIERDPRQMPIFPIF